MEVIDRGEGAFIELTDEEIISLRLALQRLRQIKTTVETGAFILPTPDEIAIATDLQAKLDKIPVRREAFIDFSARVAGESKQVPSVRIRAVRKET